MIINVSRGASTRDVIKAAGEANLSGKIVIDISNPLDFREGFQLDSQVQQHAFAGERFKDGSGR